MVSERRRGPASDIFVSVHLTHKYAETIDGVDLSHANVGDDLRLSSREASLLISEGWAVPCTDLANARGRGHVTGPQRAVATHRPVFQGGKRTVLHSRLAPSDVWVSEQDRALCRWLQRPPTQMVV